MGARGRLVLGLAVVICLAAGVAGGFILAGRSDTEPAGPDHSRLTRSDGYTVGFDTCWLFLYHGESDPWQWNGTESHQFRSGHEAGWQNAGCGTDFTDYG